jgi:hypothetical protein
MALKTNSKRILDVMVSKPNLNQTQAYKQIHPNASDNTARNNASQLLKKPEAQIYLQKHIDKAKETIVTLLDSDKPDIQLRSATDILDRTQGKATQRIEQHTTGVQFSIDLSKAVLELDNTIDATP